MAARADDVKDVGQRVLMQLLGVAHQSPSLNEPAILVCRELPPSNAAGLLPEMVLGIVTERGGATGHSAILARALGIPAVVGASGVMRNVEDGQVIGLDGDSGEVLLAPSTDEQQQLADRRAAWLAKRTESASASQRPARTKDGKQIEMGANIGSADDAERALEFGAEGVGLFRTELLFMARDEPPSEDEQTHAYSQAAAAFQAQHPNATLLIRTLDAGGDKPIAYLNFGQEENPFLGWRGIRFCLEQPEIFSTQLRAILRASANHAGICIMFPMVGTVEEVKAANAFVQQAKDELAAQQIAFNDEIEVGIMIEVPSAVLIADQLAQIVDFFSIGTNDLTQYILAADRGNARVAGLVNALDPAVLRAISTVTDAAHKHGKWVGMCGELAGNATAIPLLIGLGLDELSMSAPSIPAVKEAIRSVDTAAATELVQQVLACSSAQEVELLLES